MFYSSLSSIKKKLYYKLIIFNVTLINLILVDIKAKCKKSQNHNYEINDFADNFSAETESVSLWNYQIINLKKKKGLLN